MSEILDWKRGQLEKTAQKRAQLKQDHPLLQLFLELTLRCNERCLHCGSNCGDARCPEVSSADLERLLQKVSRDFSPLPMLAITGGEPLLRKDFERIVSAAHDLGFAWGMTTNATLIDANMARLLRRTGMGTVSVSVDGPPEVHDRIRGRAGAYDQAMRGIQAMIDEGGFKAIQITSVINHQNIGLLDQMFDLFADLDIDSWRIVAMEPIGRALTHPELLLTAQDHIRLLDFIREKREAQFPVTYGCCHYLGLAYEREVRDWFFQCHAGKTIASIMTNGDIGTCLNIPRSAQTIQGNIYRDDFTKIWNEGFQLFRGSLAEKNADCAACPHKKYCDGGSCHSWDYERNLQQVCLRGIAFS